MGFRITVLAVGGMRVEWKVIGGLDSSRREQRDGERRTPWLVFSQSVVCLVDFFFLAFSFLLFLGIGWISGGDR